MKEVVGVETCVTRTGKKCGAAICEKRGCHNEKIIVREHDTKTDGGNVSDVCGLLDRCNIGVHHSFIPLRKRGW